MFKAIIFDLDGTLLNTLEDIADSMNEALIKFGYPSVPLEKYKLFVGDGVDTFIKRVTGKPQIDKIEMEEIKKVYKEIYNRRWNLKTKPYPNILKTLQTLNEKGIKMNVLSNKPDDFTKLCVRHYFPDIKFEYIIGERKGFPIKPDPFYALEIASKLGISPEKFVYFGDTNTDMQTALNASMYPVGVLWGFRDEEELKSNGAKELISDPVEMLKFF